MAAHLEGTGRGGGDSGGGGTAEDGGDSPGRRQHIFWFLQKNVLGWKRLSGKPHICKPGFPTPRASQTKRAFFWQGPEAPELCVWTQSLRDLRAVTKCQGLWEESPSSQLPPGSFPAGLGILPPTSPRRRPLPHHRRSGFSVRDRMWPEAVGRIEHCLPGCPGAPVSPRKGLERCGPGRSAPRASPQLPRVVSSVPHPPGQGDSGFRRPGGAGAGRGAAPSQEAHSEGGWESGQEASPDCWQPRAVAAACPVSAS